MKHFLFFLATVSWLISGLAWVVLLYNADGPGWEFILCAMGALQGTIAFCAGAIMSAINPQPMPAPNVAPQ